MRARTTYVSSRRRPRAFSASVTVLPLTCPRRPDMEQVSLAGTALRERAASDCRRNEVGQRRGRVAARRLQPVAQPAQRSGTTKRPARWLSAHRSTQILRPPVPNRSVGDGARHGHSRLRGMLHPNRATAGRACWSCLRDQAFSRAPNEAAVSAMGPRAGVGPPGLVQGRVEGADCSWDLGPGGGDLTAQPRPVRNHQRREDPSLKHDAQAA